MVNYPKNLGAGSDKYGRCEICNKKMDTAYISWNKLTKRATFAHKECLVSGDIEVEGIHFCEHNGEVYRPPCPDCGSCLIDVSLGI